MATDVLMPAYRLYLNGVQMAPWVYRHITKIKFEEFEDDGATAALTIYIDDPEMQVMNSGIFVENETVIKMMIGYVTDYDDMFEGMVEVIEQDYPSSGRITLTITVKDVSYQMTRDDINKAYKGLTYSDIVTQIASKYGLTPDVDDTKYIYDPNLSAGEIINQSGKSDLDFVRYLAEEINFVFKIDSAEKKLIFKKPSDWMSDKEVEVEYKTGMCNLLSFKPKYNDYGKDKKTVAANIDPESSKETSGKEDGSSGGGGSGGGGGDDGGSKPSERSYTTVSGDCLYNIAKAQYGDANKWQEIYEANKDKVKMPGYVIQPGQSFTIP